MLHYDKDKVFQDRSQFKLYAAPLRLDTYNHSNKVVYILHMRMLLIPLCILRVDCNFKLNSCPIDNCI